MKTVYFLSGLGADQRAFSSVNLSFCKPVFLQWLVPEHDEAIETYAGRMVCQITEEDPVVVGLSFGGIMAMEMAKHMRFKRVILISSAKTYREIPWYFRFMKRIPIHRHLKASTVKRLNAFAYKLMGIEKRADKRMFMQMFSEADDRYVNWAIDKIVTWRNMQVAPDTIHIHGQQDILLPHFFVRPDHSIPGGKHLMPMIQPELISRLLSTLLPLN